MSLSQEKKITSANNFGRVRCRACPPPRQGQYEDGAVLVSLDGAAAAAAGDAPEEVPAATPKVQMYVYTYVPCHAMPWRGRSPSPDCAEQAEDELPMACGAGLRGIRSLRQKRPEAFI